MAALWERSDCILTLVERKTGYVLIGKLRARTAAEANRALLALMARHPGRTKTITADNGTEPSGARWTGRRPARRVTPEGVIKLNRAPFRFARPYWSTCAVPV